ncbi:MAG: hypothetical protein MJZ30_06065 [Paludibacteraceae bacterium]|nr:hypothetical protein [Paludibacteraceae bacterium]
MCDDRMSRRYGMRDDEYRHEDGDMSDRMGERRGVKGTGRYGMGRRYGMRDPYYD